VKPLTPEQLQLKQAILDHVYRSGYQPVKPRVIAKKLGLAPEQKDDFKRAVKFLIREGKLAYGAKHLIRPIAEEVETETPQAPASTTKKSKGVKKTAPATSAKDHVGVFRRNPRGFGFIRPKGSEGKDREEVDVYIPANRTGNASSGDLVRFQLIRSSDHFRRRQGGSESSRLKGSIVEVLERRTTRFVGTFREGRSTSQVIVDGNCFTEPITIRPEDTLEAQTGDKVVVEVVHFPSAYNDGLGTVTEVLGRADDPEVDFQTILNEFSLPDAFEPDTLTEAEKVAEAFDEKDLSGRTDLTGTTVVTIDPIDARDFDDAISLERIDENDWLLGVHIADVAHFVRGKSALDRAARDRATSVYLPDRVIPMLPETISNHLASLQPHKNRYTKTVFVRFSANGTFLEAKFARSVIRSDQRLTYEEVDEFIEDPDPNAKTFEEKWGPAVCDLLGRMHELAVLLRARRFARGSLELAMPDVRINLGETGEVIGAETVESTESRRIIEEFMLAANEAVAQELTDREIRFMRRTHGKPSPRKMEQLSQFVRELGFDIDSLEDRFALQQLLITTADVPESRAVHYAVLRSMQRAVYSGKASPEGHYALATENYCHFTSPIRRYPDLTVHRVLDRLFDGKNPSVEQETLNLLAEHCSDREQRAEAAERASVELKLIRYLETRPGEQFDAIITGVERFGLFVQGLDLPVEGLVPVDSLPYDRYYHDRTTHTLAGHRPSNQFRLGDLMRVELARVDAGRREIQFRPLMAEDDHDAPRLKKRRSKSRKPRHKPKHRKRDK
jgi:ribonuclease R